MYNLANILCVPADRVAFGSTYAREINFRDEEWLARIKNPSAVTFVAVRSSDDRVVASTSLIGPLPNGGPVSNPTQAISTVPHGHAHDRDSTTTASTTNKKPNDDGDDSNQNGSKSGSGDEGEPLCFQMAAVYTSPEARGRGLAKSLIKAATEEAHKKAVEKGRPLALSVVVYATNDAAIAVYERCGFVKSAHGPNLKYNALKNSSASELEMHFAGTF
jgi:ribosomal protein S18 acetylase RimI-like enzyme